MRTWVVWIGLGLGLVGLLQSPAAAIPLFARIYDKPCGTCHTVFPQLNPEGENFRAHGLHGLRPAIKPLNVGPYFDVPGTLPLAVYIIGGEDFSHVSAPGQADSTRANLDLDYFKLLAGGEIGRHLAFLADYELLETEPDTGATQINTLPHQAYIVAHAEPWGWLGNLKGGWYELPLTVSPDIHRLSAHPYLIYGLSACALLDVASPHGSCDDTARLGDPQIGMDLGAVQPARGVSWNVGVTTGSNNRLDTSASPDLYLHLSQALGLHRLGFFVFYAPDLVGGGVHDRTLRLGPDMDFYTRQLRVLGQFLAAQESNPTGHRQDLWYWGGFLEADYRWTPALLSLLRLDSAWMPRFDDTAHGGDTQVRRRIWEATAGCQWSIWDDLKLAAEVTYGENHEAVSDQTTQTWTGTVRLITAFWPFAPPGFDGSLKRESGS